MSNYYLPTSLTVSGVDFSIRTDFRAIIDVLIAFSDDELTDDEKCMVALQIIYVDWEKISEKDYNEAIKKAFEFIDCGNTTKDDTPQPRLVDWEKDANIIIPAVNKVAGKEIRAVEYVHWWTFVGYYMEIGECLFSSVVNIRMKKAKHKKLEKYEKDFYKDNKELIDLKQEKRSAEEQSALDELFG